MHSIDHVSSSLIGKQGDSTTLKWAFLYIMKPAQQSITWY